MQGRRGDFFLSFLSCGCFEVASFHHGQVPLANIMYQRGINNGYIELPLLFFPMILTLLATATAPFSSIS